MTNEQKLNYLSKALLVFGLIFLVGLYPMMNHIFPAGWSWTPNQPEYEQMIMGVYAVLGLYMIKASKDPMQHLSLIGFAAWSSLVHAAIMLIQALNDPTDMDNVHPLGDVPALFLVAIVLLYLTPKEAKSE